ncbi:MAG: UDP-N-acetylglucosamine 2-epimerase (non-hydrolyzing) [Planctomycetes bacterium]|nr:UDP-N-acetylglucosamine 2-epimerase (non-hydrolyzing) [Planctomycetota bacterium]
MSAKPAVLVVVGTRPEAVKLAPVVHALQRHPHLTTRVLATAQHRHLLDQIHEFFAITPDRDLDLMRPDQSLADLTARMIAALDPVLAAEQPALVLAQGDTTTVMVTALACFYRRIPFGHVEAGLRTGDTANPFPEEMNRVLVGRMARLHFAPTDTSRDNLLREGTDPAAVHTTGNTVIDALLWAAERVDPAPFRPAPGKRLVLVTAHRRENFGQPFEHVCAALRELADRPDVQMLYPVHPNPNVRDVAHRVLAGHPSIQLVDPLDYPAMVAAMRACDLILTDSGGVQEEAPSLGKPVLVLRSTTERPEGVQAGAARLVGTDRRAIVAAATELLDDPAAYAAMANVVNPYGDGRAAERIAAIVSDFLAATEPRT